MCISSPCLAGRTPAWSHSLAIRFPSFASMTWCTCPATGVAYLPSAQNKAVLKGKASGTRGGKWSYVPLMDTGPQHWWIHAEWYKIRSAFCHFLKRNEGKYGIQASGGDSVWLNSRRLLDPGWARELSTRLLGWEQAGAGRSPAASWQQLKSRESL